MFHSILPDAVSTSSRALRRAHNDWWIQRQGVLNEKMCIRDRFKIPVKYIGLGEGIEAMQVFRKKEFVDSLFGETA